MTCEYIDAVKLYPQFSHRSIVPFVQIVYRQCKLSVSGCELSFKIAIGHTTSFHLFVLVFFLKGASDIVDVENIRHITENQTLIGDVVGKTADDWKAQKELFYQKTGIHHQPVRDSVDVVGEEQDKSQQEVAEEQDGNEDFSKELEEVLLSAQNDSDFEE